ncbi:2-dehydropantoate 2-reductase N-terminal domain-containing protein [Faecalicoccus pleomorphus]|uniref:2-dehydropantoate 2-reductase N-terminal domain-containing protein n=1 Tax=Faecalicoccus pleomorphus TaxID=1323 RepID=A0AAW6CWR6_9FIRM|nr:2-dehydropantoate 2-reductase N-terminal domain-containing protein [Faecalicoccus pleomorphus]MDB7980650.1 2-dehydropantoate 2-reductase N-terminal domain-containing protein [Faecalicoccus pleomorphus]MDB7982857.1 2-dehydropantoate 2-reductase N-terminal domain-containing protein [Faecalicoccus pleomorphus]MDM8293031.1 2-dehydropantoate 2-reductase N-terminal domain-containing protein [Faecalicoccus pleomorphus]
MKKISIIGAGPIGKGVLLPLFQSHGYEVTLLNRSKEKLNQIKEGYTVNNDGQSSKYCPNAVVSLEEATTLTPLIALAVSSKALPAVLKFVGNTLQPSNNPYTLLICSNQMNVQQIVKKYFQENFSGVSFLQTIEIQQIICCIGARNDSNGKDVVINTKHGCILLEKGHWMDTDINEFIASDDIQADLTIKLCLINRLQLHLALLGKKKGYKTLGECFSDGYLMSEVIASYQEVISILKLRYPKADISKKAQLYLLRVMNGKNEDIHRFLQNIDKKLEPNDRIELPIQIAKQIHYPIHHIQSLRREALAYIKKERDIL